MEYGNVPTLKLSMPDLLFLKEPKSSSKTLKYLVYFPQGLPSTEHSFIYMCIAE
jgi:hypothetical protein